MPDFAVLSAPCDCCGKNFPLEESPPYSVTVRHDGEKSYSTLSLRLCPDCFEGLKIEFERLKNL